MVELKSRAEVMAGKHRPTGAKHGIVPLGGDGTHRGPSVPPYEYSFKNVGLWQSRFRNTVAENARTVGDCVRSMREALRAMPTPLGTFARNLDSPLADPGIKPFRSRGGGTLGAASADLFPVHTTLGVLYACTLPEAPAGALGVQVRDWLWCLLVVLSFYGIGAWTTGGFQWRHPPALHAGQRGSIRRLHAVLVDFLGRTREHKMCIAEEVRNLRTRVFDYGGEPLAKLRWLVAAKVVPTWPAKGFAASVEAVQCLEGELRDDMLDPRRLLLPAHSWPPSPPTSRVHATDAEWYLLCKAAGELGIMRRVYEHEIVCDAAGNKVLAGAM